MASQTDQGSHTVVAGSTATSKMPYMHCTLYVHTYAQSIVCTQKAYVYALLVTTGPLSLDGDDNNDDEAPQSGKGMYNIYIHSVHSVHS